MSHSFCRRIAYETRVRFGYSNTDYKAIRRNVVMYDRLSTLDKKKTVTRLLIASRAKLRTADIIDDLEKLAAVNDLETARVQDNES